MRPKILKFFNWISPFVIVFSIIFFWQELNKFLSPPTYDFIHHTHRILYVERRFSNEEFAIISSAAEEWNQKTNHIIQFDVVRLPTNEKIDIINGIFIIKYNEDNPYIIPIDGLNDSSTLGFYTTENSINEIGLIPDRFSFRTYKPVILHELGHSLGLQHNEDIGTLMYPYMDLAADDITEEDLKNFCVIYQCK